MQPEFVQIFIYLALAYTVDGFLMSASRRLRLPDFLAHILTGVMLGGIALLYTKFFGDKPPGFLNNEFVAYLSYFGLILFLMQLGFSFDPKFSRLDNDRRAPQVAVFILLNVFILGLIGYFGLTGGSIKGTIFIIIAFLSINIGAMLTSNFPINPVLKRPMTNLIQTAVIVDLFAILAFSFMEQLRFWGEFNGGSVRNLIFYGFILLLFLLPVVIPEWTTRLYRGTEKVIGQFTTVFKIGLFFVFLFAGFRLGFSILLMGIWGGMVFRNFAGENRFDVAERTFALSSFLYVLPFVQIGQMLIVDWQENVLFWQNLAYILMGLMLVSMIFGLIFLKAQRFAKLLAMGVFARGELSLIILWLGNRVEYIDDKLFIVAVVAVVASSLIGKLMFLRPLKVQAAKS